MGKAQECGTVRKVTVGEKRVSRVLRRRSSARHCSSADATGAALVLHKAIAAHVAAAAAATAPAAEHLGHRKTVRTCSVSPHLNT